MLGVTENVKSGLRSFMQIPRWMMLHSQVDELKLIAIKSRHKLRTTNVIPLGDSQHTQNIQIDKVIGKNEKCVSYFTEKTIWTFWPTQ